MKATNPSQDLIRYLIKNYYEDDIKAQEDKFVSSHWKYYSDLLEIRVDSKGNLISLSGVGFGALKWGNRWKRPIQWFMDQLCIFSHLVHLPHRRDILRLRRVSAKTCKEMELDIRFDAFRQMCSLELLRRNLKVHLGNKPLYVLMIGDGYGFLSAVFKSIFPNATVAMVDIGKTLLFQAYYCQKAHPECTHTIAEIVTDIDSVDFVYCPADQLETLERFKFDIAISIASMQEMDGSTVERYFDFLRKCLQPNNLFYCCNRETKTLRGGEVSEFMKYPWQDGDRYLVNGYCPWHQYFFSPGRSKNGLYLFGVRVPFINFYDGKHVHRLAVLDTN